MQSQPSAVLAETLEFPAFSLVRLLKTVFAPEGGERYAIMIDLDDPREIENFRFLSDPRYSIQKHAHDDFYQPLLNGAGAELSVGSVDIFAYRVTGGSNLDLPDEAWTPDGKQVSLGKDVYPNYDLFLCISTFSATAPLTAFAKQYGFRGATLHGVNDVILRSGLAVDYNEVSQTAEKLRLGLTKADAFEIDFVIGDTSATLRLITNRQEAQKSHGLCLGKEPDIANLPAGEVYYVPEDAEGEFPLKFEDGTIGLMTVAGGRIVKARLLKGDPAVIEAYQSKIEGDPVAGEIGELGFGTQILPVSGRDIQDEKVLGTMHVATGRSDHLGGHLTPDKFAKKLNATHDDILFAPHKTPEVKVPEVRMYRDGKVVPVIRDYRAMDYLLELIAD